jgi:riboflavin synthase
MFTGIVESTARIVNILPEGENLHFTLTCAFTAELKIDQSLAHNGVCLTVVHIQGDEYTVTAIAETLQKTTLKHWRVGDAINLERCLRLGDRLDGHWVQGHVDTTATCLSIEEEAGSWRYVFALQDTALLVGKGSVTIDGVSLTVVSVGDKNFSVAIIPYTKKNTNFVSIQVGQCVNIEFDVLGKYIDAYLKNKN